MKSHNYHVVPNEEGGWDVKEEFSIKATGHYETQKEAIDSARKLSRESKSELVIHGKDGEIVSRDSHGQDPFPPKG